MKIISHYHRDELLHNLYQNKELLCFVNSIDWFKCQVYNIWQAYYEHVKMPIKFQDVKQDSTKWEFYNL